jgi:hypothetical protein
MSKTISLEVDDNGCVEVAFNNCYGGFSISKKAILRMIELGSEEAKHHYDATKHYDHFGSYNPDVPRFDPILIQTIKELGKAACGSSAALAIGKVRLDDLITIDEHDGKEDVNNQYDATYYGRDDDDDG